MAGELVLLTGATGYLGYLTLVDLLKAGYRVRAAYRSQAKVNKVLAAPSLKALSPTAEQLEWVSIPDMTAPGAYDAAAQGATYIVHVASPIPTFGGEPIPQDKYDEYFVTQPVRSDVGMLESARKAGTVRRIVLTSSVVANTPFDYYMGKGDYSVVFDAESRIPDAKGPFGFEFEAYSAGKAAALNAAEAWVKHEKPAFDLITIIPGWIFGRDELSQTAADLESGTTNSVLLGYLRGGKNDSPFNGNAVLGDEVAKVHVLALDPKVAGNQSFVTSRQMVWEEALETIKESFPEAIEEGKLSTEGVQNTLDIKLSSKKTEDTFGFKFSPFQDIVKAVAGQYLELAA